MDTRQIGKTRFSEMTEESTGYFVYCNGDADKEAFDGKLEFDVKLIPYRGDDSWVEGVIVKLKPCLMANKLPASEVTCDYCAYYEARKSV